MACYRSVVPVNSTHPEYDANLPNWLRARDVVAGEDAVKYAGVRYLPRLDSQTDEEYKAYRARASFFNATARTVEGFVGMIFRRLPFIKLPDQEHAAEHLSPSLSPKRRGSADGPEPEHLTPSLSPERRGGGFSALGRALATFKNDADMLGTPLVNYAKNVVNEIIAVGRAGTLVDWENEVENRVYASLYAAESILNWRVERVNGRNIPTLIVLRECTGAAPTGAKGEDPFLMGACERIRVLKLVKDVSGATPETTRGARVVPMRCEVEIWHRMEKKGKREKVEWELVETRIPLRLGKPLSLIPFVFHGPLHAQPAVEKLPLADIIPVNLDHYRLDADYKHGVHFTALPTAWVSGFDKASSLRIGSSSAWVTETPGATAGFLEFTGQGLETFERAMDRDERLLAVLGSRLLEGHKKVGETAQSIELRQSGENSILGNIAVNAGASLTQVLRWAYWWNSTEASPDDVTNDRVLVELNTDFSAKGLSAAEIHSIVAAWQASAISRDTMTELFRRGEVLPEGRNVQEEERLIAAEGTRVPATALARGDKTGAAVH